MEDDVDKEVNDEMKGCDDNGVVLKSIMTFLAMSGGLTRRRHQLATSSGDIASSG